MDASDQNPKAKTIATIDINLMPPKVSKAEWLAETVNEHFHCVLCGDELNFQHQTDFVQQTVSEDAHCPSCNVRNRQNSYTLQ
jgi:plasmid rolling circle replication initiator protein Rep